MAQVSLSVREVVCIFASSVWPTTLAESDRQGGNRHEVNRQAVCHFHAQY